MIREISFTHVFGRCFGGDDAPRGVTVGSPPPPTPTPPRGGGVVAGAAPPLLPGRCSSKGLSGDTSASAAAAAVVVVEGDRRVRFTTLLWGLAIPPTPTPLTLSLLLIDVRLGLRLVLVPERAVVCAAVFVRRDASSDVRGLDKDDSSLSAAMPWCGGLGLLLLLSPLLLTMTP